MSSVRLRVAVPIAAAVLALGLLHLSAPAYLVDQGFPVDDAWIHAVYAREFGRTATLAYNPGVPSSGETSPLWAIVLAPAYRVAGSPDTAVRLAKATGFTLHVAGAVILTFALAPLVPGEERWAWLSGAVVAMHPDLIAASVSGMEVSLATTLAAAAVLATVRGSAAALSIVAALAFAGRPETPLLMVAFAFLFWIGSHPRRAFGLAAAAAGGGLAGAIVVGIRNHLATGWYLPATFHAKAAGSLNLLAIYVGFRDVIARLPPVTSGTVLLGVVAWSIALVRGAKTPDVRGAAALFLAAVTFCSVSFALIPPADPQTFYHERYVLPGLFFMVAALPFLARQLSTAFTARSALTGTAVLLIAPLVIASPGRYSRLANDTRNIDDVQVAFGKSLAGRNRSETLWAVDAGASRFFGAPYVVDTVGLNSPDILQPRAQMFLDAHPPRYLDVFPSWSEIEGDAGRAMPHRVFAASSEYTVTSRQLMREHVLVECAPPSSSGVFTVLGRRFRFRCAS